MHLHTGLAFSGAKFRLKTLHAKLMPYGISTDRAAKNVESWTVIYPDVSVEVWCRKYPALRELQIGKCSCGQPVQELKPYYAKYTLGLVSGMCSCGTEGAFFISIPREGPLLDAFAGALLTL